MQTRTTGNKLFAAVTALAAAFAVTLQLYSNLSSNRSNLLVTENLLQFFTYFTILSNLLVAICCASVAAGADNFFTRSKVLNATAAYIAIVGVIYNTVLRGQFNLMGIDKFLNEILHVVVPALYLIYWLIFVPKSNLQWKDALPWLWYPLIYLIIVLIRGAVSDHYPYPFVDVKTIGYNKALLNSLFVTIGFLVVSLIIIGAGKLLSRKNNG